MDLEPKPWRTATVVHMCDHILEREDWGALPILADALEDGGYEDEAVLKVMRGKSDAWQARRLIAMVKSEETLTALQWMEKFAANLSDSDNWWGKTEDMDVYTLLAGAEDYVKNDETVCQNGGQSWDGLLEDNLDEFWDAYAKLTGKPVDGERRASFFSCSC